MTTFAACGMPCHTACSILHFNLDTRQQPALLLYPEISAFRNMRGQLGALLLLLVTVSASRNLQQTYDCEEAEQECRRVSCNGGWGRELATRRGWVAVRGQTQPCASVTPSCKGRAARGCPQPAAGQPAAAARAPTKPRLVPPVRRPAEGAVRQQHGTGAVHVRERGPGQLLPGRRDRHAGRRRHQACRRPRPRRSCAGRGARRPPALRPRGPLLLAAPSAARHLPARAHRRRPQHHGCARALPPPCLTCTPQTDSTALLSRLPARQCSRLCCRQPAASPCPWQCFALPRGPLQPPTQPLRPPTPRFPPQPPPATTSLHGRRPKRRRPSPRCPLRTPGRSCCLQR
jgi:hypothetical protein